MGDLNLTFKRKKSVAQFNYSEHELGVNIPLSLLGKKFAGGILDNLLPGEEVELLDGGKEGKKDKKKKKKDARGNVKLEPGALVGLAASLLIASMSMPDKAGKVKS